MLEFLKQFNWVDVFVFVLLFRVCYISMANGFVTELFKLLGTISAIYFSCHYYIVFLAQFKKQVASQFLPADFLDFVSFVLLALAGYVLWLLVRLLFSKAIKTEAHEGLDKWGGLTMGVIRGFLLAGLLTFMFMASSLPYFRAITSVSYFGQRVNRIAPAVYRGMWYGVMSKFMLHENFNKSVDETVRPAAK